MNTALLGVLCGVIFGVADVLMTVFGNHPDVSRSMLLQAFSSRLAIGVLGANVSLRFHEKFGENQGSLFGISAGIFTTGPPSTTKQPQALNSILLGAYYSHDLSAPNLDGKTFKGPIQLGSNSPATDQLQGQTCNVLQGATACSWNPDFEPRGPDSIWPKQP